MNNDRCSCLLGFAALCLTTYGIPSQNNFHAVTNDWYNGNWSNVYELAQLRLAANSNDLVAAHIMHEYDICFSDFSAMSNSLVRLVHSSDMATNADYAQLYCQFREGYLWYLNEFLPTLTDEFRIQDQKTYSAHSEMVSTFWLRLLMNCGLW